MVYYHSKGELEWSNKKNLLNYNLWYWKSGTWQKYNKVMKTYRASYCILTILVCSSLNPPWLYYGVLFIYWLYCLQMQNKGKIRVFLQLVCFVGIYILLTVNIFSGTVFAPYNKLFVFIYLCALSSCGCLSLIRNKTMLENIWAYPLLKGWFVCINTVFFQRVL